MFSFLKKRKIKKSEPIISENKENHAYDYSLSLVSPETHDKNLANDNIHIDVTQNPSSKSLISYDDSNEASPRDLSSTSHPHRTALTHTIGTVTPSQIGRSDLNRILTSGYLNGEENMGYMKRGGSDHIASCTKSPQFHRPVGFSYNRTQKFSVPGTKKGMKALVTAQTKVRKVHCSTSPSVATLSDHENKIEEEPIILSRYSGGFIPDPAAPKKIESLDWPAPIAMQAVPELMKSYRSRSESRANPNEIIQRISISDEQIISSENTDPDYDDDQLRVDQKLEKDIDIMSKIKESSGMAHALLENLRIQEKIISRQLPLDPWKASRSPSAAIEPPRRCRFESPTFASPSRRVHTHSSSMTNQDDSLAGLSASMSTTPAITKNILLPRYQQQHEILVLRPDDNSLPSLKAQTLPNRLDIQRNCDIESTTNSCYSNDRDQDKSVKTVDVEGRYTHSTHSAPALMSNPKIYAYEDLKILLKKRLPSDVDRDHLERHLSNDEFHSLFQMSRSEFYNLPEWRRVDLKKRWKLF
ncbi:unnamed protein product [Rotaria socialis]|uniref:HP domain-containing protein n=1 Tax=Rotaria socialis TaxID=392032 RepID=A0A820HG04_9BILA|nr:unnamed protein product [Rotaria socialis]CAF3380527.1 unnamed protein product [Rotaria socialis]CAF3463928.1 unnamed protein product [Rotaria socialis]CAF3502484.1 unnamed protein product [Rotaria socialis]CAF4294123.1 unnamed protein product [Rotaria socialis]